jgi:hypothetical protein
MLRHSTCQAGKRSYLLADGASGPRLLVGEDGEQLAKIEHRLTPR